MNQTIKGWLISAVLMSGCASQGDNLAGGGGGGGGGGDAAVGKNPPGGATIYYALGAKPDSATKVSVPKARSVLEVVPKLYVSPEKRLPSLAV